MSTILDCLTDEELEKAMQTAKELADAQTKSMVEFRNELNRRKQLKLYELIGKTYYDPSLKRHCKIKEINVSPLGSITLLYYNINARLHIRCELVEYSCSSDSFSNFLKSRGHEIPSSPEIDAIIELHDKIINKP
jgi:hypothetical protein